MLPRLPLLLHTTIAAPSLLSTLSRTPLGGLWCSRDGPAVLAERLRRSSCKVVKDGAATTATPCFLSVPCPLFPAATHSLPISFLHRNAAGASPSKSRVRARRGTHRTHSDHPRRPQLRPVELHASTVEPLHPARSPPPHSLPR